MLSRRTALTLGLFALGDRLVTSTQAATRPSAARPDGRAHRLTLHPDGFRLDDVPFQIRSGEMHPARIPRREWAHRIAMAKAMGLNTIGIYLIWNTLETSPNVFDLHTDRRNFAAFIRLCQEAGLWVFLRPGPYICGEWDFGGLPPYLLFDGDIALRTRDPAFLSACERYIATLAPVLRPFLSQNGGPILLTQIENEYASFGGDIDYMHWTRNAWERHGIPGPFTIADGLPQLREKRIFLPDCAIGLDGENNIADTRALAPDAPFWISEAYPGWLTHWGEKAMARVDFTKDFHAILRAGVSFNLYVVHGGTNFGFGAGANAHRDGSSFQPVVTSYDYDAPIDEAGRPTAKFHALRAALLQATGTPAAQVPKPPDMTDFQAVIPAHVGRLENLLPPPLHAEHPVSLERGLRQGHGMALYRVTIPPNIGGMLRLPPVHDYARIFLDGTDIGTISRMVPNDADTMIPPTGHPRRLDIWVDSFGHIGYGAALGDRKGLDGPVTLGNHILHDWQIFGLPLGDRFIAQCAPLSPDTDARGFLFRASFDLRAPGGTYVDLSNWKKGYCWINGHLLGRYWHIGPQQRLYCPAEWLKPSGNDLMLLDYHQKEPAPVIGKTSLEN